MKQRDVDDIYKNVPIDEIPWNMEDPPEAIVALVETGRI
jgi:hypothetical protein